MVTALVGDWWNPCNWGVVKTICGAAGDAAKAVGGAVLDTILHPLADAVGTVLRALMTFWLKVPSPDFADPSGPVAHLQHLNVWLAGLIGVIAMLIAGARLALSRGERSHHQILAGILAIALSGMAVPVVGALAAFGDQYSTWILNSGNTGFDDRAGMFITGFASLSPGLILILAPIIVLCSVAQIMLLIVRVGALTIILGCLPIVAAASTTQAGMHALKKACGWILAFLLYGPLAATIYAAAFLMVGTGKDITSVLAGMATMVLALIALPALMRLVQPLVSAATMSGGGGALAGAAAVGATGARLAAESHDRRSSSSTTPSGATPGSGGSAGKSGPSGGSGAGGAAGSNGAAANSAAKGSAATTVGAVLVGAQAANGARKTAAGSVPNGHKQEKQ